MDRWMRCSRRLILVSFLLQTVVLVPNEYVSGVLASQNASVEPATELQESPVGKASGVVTAQNVCLACDLRGVEFLRRPPDMNYTEGSKGNYLMWMTDYFTNYTVIIPVEVVAQGWRTYGQEFLSAGRVSITREHSYHNVTVNVDGLDPGYTLYSSYDPSGYETCV